MTLSQTATPPLAPDLSPDASFRSTSSAGLNMATPVTEAGSPLQSSRLKLRTPAALHEMTHSSSTSPMPAINSLLGSPFNARKPLPFEFSIASPTWNHGKDNDANLFADGWDAKSSSPMDMIGGLSPCLSKPYHYHSADEGSGSCTSASSSSMFSPENGIGSGARPSVVSLWNDDSGDEDVPPAARTKLFVGRSLKGKKSATRLKPGPASPLVMSCTTNNTFSSSPDSSPVQTTFLSASTSAVEGRSIAGGLQSPVEDYFSRRPQSARKRTPNDRFASSPHELFLSQCNSRGFELTPRPDGPRTPVIPMSDDIAESDHSPLRHNAAAVHALPLSPSAPLLSRRPEGLQLHLTPRNHSPVGVTRSKSNRGARSLPTRPTLRRGLTEPANKTPKAPPVPQLGTPVSELFGDEKPSPAAFSSTGLVKKRGARLNIPRFAAKLKAPQPLSFDDKPKTQAAASAPTSGSDTETDDSEGDQLSPIKPLRSGPFRMSLNSTRTHSRNGSLASDIASSPFRRSHGHARMSSTASSIGGSKGLRRKSSAMFTSAGSIASDTEFSPATPTKPLPLAREYPIVEKR